MSPYSFIHKFIEFPVYHLGHRCESSETVQYGIGVKSAKRPGQALVANALATQIPGTVEMQRREGWLCMRARWCLYHGEVGVGAGSVRVRKDDPTGCLWLWPMRVSEVAKKAHRYCVLRNNFFYEELWGGDYFSALMLQVVSCWFLLQTSFVLATPLPLEWPSLIPTFYFESVY